ncbi:hypothetical protein ACOSP7_023964 [Xanthoceras sorbifolium]|uniref:Uncharacterized protein n=1 Tax=Xanthoceras sorbifolium TaxID=99658 RepID=A0ABQ8H9J9_9ROSI|nr:hypothetical protein JRO89_XS13G0229800 [Xanthoceras sorbifolium]
MKSSSLAFSFTFLFVAFITKPLSAAAAPEPLVDIRGDKVRTGTTYQIVSAIQGAGGGGLTLNEGRDGLCPLDVYQYGSDLLWGLPFFFSPINSTIIDQYSYVYDSTDLNIIFGPSPFKICNEPKVFKVDSYDEPTGQWFITSNGAIGNPGPQTLHSWFKFEKVNGKTYKIKYCPSVCESCVSLCSDVGIYYDDRLLRRLVLSERPFLVNIYKAEAEDASKEKIAI